MNQEIVETIAYLSRVKKLDRDFVITALKDAIASVLKKKYGPDFPVEVKVDGQRGDIQILVQKVVVVEKVQDPDREISLEEARQQFPDIEPGETIMTQLPFDQLGRGIVSRIRNNFTQRIREAEKLRIYKDFQNRIGELIKARVWRVDKTGVYLNVGGGAEGLIPPEEQIPGERYRTNRDVYALILRVDKETRRKPLVFLSRTHPDFLRRLMEHEIPEVADGTVEIRAVARIPGKRAKVAVRSKDPRVDPVGACIGPRGQRINPVVRELGNEKIDIIRWYPDTIRLAASALSPAVPLMIFEKDDTIYAVVRDEEIAETKGKEGLNVILASRIVGKDIQVIPASEYEPPADVLTVMELDLPEEVKEKLRRAGWFQFTEVPLLADLIETTDLDEKTVLRILHQIEEGLEKKRGSA